MPTRFKVDEDLPYEVAECLHSAGHDVCTVLNESLSGAADDQIWEAVCEEQRCLVTADKGFADARSLQSPQHHGVVLLRLVQESRTAYAELIERFLAEFNADDLAGAIIVVSPDVIRVRRSADNV